MSRLLIFLFALSSVFLAPSGHACTCGRTSEEEGFQYADTVLMAETVSAVVEDDPEFGTVLRVGVRVMETLKGDGNIREIRTPVGNGSCGKTIVVPERYWFYLDSHHMTDRCTATRTILETEDQDLLKFTMDVLRNNLRRQATAMRAIDAACERAIKDAELASPGASARIPITVPNPIEPNTVAPCNRLAEQAQIEQLRAKKLATPKCEQ